MTIASAPHPPAVAATLASWHRMVASSDRSTLPSLLHADATFRTDPRHRDQRVRGEEMGRRIGPLLAAFKTSS